MDQLPSFIVNSCQQCHFLCQCTTLAFSNVILLPWAYLEAHPALVKDMDTVGTDIESTTAAKWNLDHTIQMHEFYL